MKTLHRTLGRWFVVTLVMTGLTIPAAYAGVGLVTKEELKPMLDDPDLVILDVRSGKDWKSSEFKIKGATYVASNKYADWAGSYPKDKKYVVYCA